MTTWLAYSPDWMVRKTAHHQRCPQVLNALNAFALNLSVFLLLGRTSALTMNICGLVKDWFTIAGECEVGKLRGGFGTVRGALMRKEGEPEEGH